MKARLVLVVLFAGFLWTGAAPAQATCPGFNCDAGASGVDLVDRIQLQKLQRAWVAAQTSPKPRYEYKTVDSCAPGGSKAGQEDCITNRIFQICAGDDGPLVDIIRRKVDATGKVTEPWALIGLTCLPNEVPGAAKRPTMAMIVDAFHHTAWAKASIGFQPKGYLTLVNLPSFYQAQWSAAGFGPGEVDAVDPATMFGHSVSIRPKLVSFTYHFGDGTTLGPTTSPGGVYPNGDVRHTYAKAGNYRAFVTVVWGADFKVDNGPWEEIPNTVPVDQPAQQIQVRTATNRLVQ